MYRDGHINKVPIPLSTFSLHVKPPVFTLKMPLTLSRVRERRSDIHLIRSSYLEVFVVLYDERGSDR